MKKTLAAFLASLGLTFGATVLMGAGYTAPTTFYQCASGQQCSSSTYAATVTGLNSTAVCLQQGTTIDFSSTAASQCPGTAQMWWDGGAGLAANQGYQPVAVPYTALPTCNAVNRGVILLQTAGAFAGNADGGDRICFCVFQGDGGFQWIGLTSDHGILPGPTQGGTSTVCN